MTQTASEPPVKLEVLAARERAAKLLVVDAATFALAGNELTTLKGLRKRLDEFFDPTIKKAFEAHKSAVAMKREITDPLDQAERHYKGQLGAWQAKEREEARQREIALQDEARKREEKRRLDEAVALEKSGRKAEAERVLDRPIAQAPVVVAPNVPKVKGVSFSEKWSARVVDLRLLVEAVAAKRVPIQALMPDQKFLDGQARFMHEGLDFPGVTVEKETITSGRAS